VNNKNLQVSDTQFHYEGSGFCGLSVVIASYKHSNLHPKTIYIPREILLLRYIQIFFWSLVHGVSIYPGRSTVSHPHLSSRLKSILRFNHFNPTFYKGHRFRTGAATSAAARGVPISIIQNMGRWKSDAVKKTT